MLPQPNWAYWSNLADVELSAAAALSCDVSPESIEGEQPIGTFGIGSEVWRRTSIARSHIEEEMLVTRRRAGLEGAEQEFVKLTDFRAWGESLPSPFTFPAKFPRATAQTSEAMTQSMPMAPSKSLRSDTRRNWLRIIRAIYEKANLPEHEAASTIEKMIQALGFDGPKDDTVRNVLKEALALRPDPKPK